MIYIITDGLYCKVGIAECMKRRLSALQNGNPRKIEVLATFEGGRPLERRIHNALPNRLRVGREWFKRTPELERLINLARDGGTVWDIGNLLTGIERERDERRAQARSGRAELKAVIRERSQKFVRNLCDQHGRQFVAKVAGKHPEMIAKYSRGECTIGSLPLARLGLLDPVGAKAVIGLAATCKMDALPAIKSCIEALSAFVAETERERLRVVS